MAAVAAELWRASVTTRGAAMPELPEGLEEDALSVSTFEIEDEATATPSGWRVELLYRERPDPAPLEAALARACAAAGSVLEGVAVEPVPETDWVAAASLRLPPIVAGRFVVHGSHARGALPAGLVPVEVEAGLAFGSGEHATTRSCLLAIDRLARTRRFRRVLDLGCGSGVLAIAAARCWTAEVVAVDNDPIAVRVAAENARTNFVAARVRAVLADGYRHPLVRRRAPFDLVLANILADPLVELAPALRRHLAPGGHAVVSGLLDRQADAVVAAHREQGLRLADRLDHGPWTALVMRLPPASAMRA
ncbi:MAG TPA: 50S ribosomal protein L11 methyltransferase [Geminicoccaceae bacterium]|nr:50S ribosomal protein L11 methyltransferase [Geminicoccaceae bacterium]